MILKKCMKCGAEVEVLKNCTCNDCGIVCCGEKMTTINPNTVDCAVEKHLPQAEKAGNYVVVTVNHVMEQEHFIEWLGIEAEGISAKKYFDHNCKAKAVFPYVKGAKIYAYCNKHGLWSITLD